MPFLPLDYPDVRAAIGRLLPEKTYLITGALREEPAPAIAPARCINVSSSVSVTTAVSGGAGSPDQEDTSMPVRRWRSEPER